MRKVLIALAILGLLAAACGPPDEGPSEGQARQVTVEFKTPLPESTQAKLVPTATPVPPPPRVL